MTNERLLAIVAACAAILALFHGFVDGKISSYQQQVQLKQVDLAREYTDYIITKRLAAKIQTGEEFFVAKEQAIDQLQKQILTASKAAIRWGWIGTTLTVGLLICQIIIAEVALAPLNISPTRRRMRMAMIMLVIASGMAALLSAVLLLMFS